MQGEERHSKMRVYALESFQEVESDPSAERLWGEGGSKMWQQVGVLEEKGGFWNGKLGK